MATFTVTGSDLHAAADWATRIVPARPAVPQLGGLLIEATGDELSLSAFDFDTAGTVTIPAVVAEDGTALLSARLLAAIAKTVARDVDVTITVDGTTATARCGRSEWSLPTMPAEDFPALPKLAEPVGEVDAEQLRHALARVLPALHSGNEAALENLAGVKVDGTADGLTLVATDRYRVAVAELDWKLTGEPIDALVPSDLLEAAARAAGTGTVSLFCGDSTFGLSTDTHRIVGRQIATRYPDLSKFMPVPGEHAAVINVADLSRAVDEAMVMLDKEPAVKLSFGADSVEVSAVGDGRRATANAQVHELFGEPIVVAVNAGYLRTALKLVESDAAAVHFTSRAVLMLPTDAEGNIVDGYSHVVMRTRVS